MCALPVVSVPTTPVRKMQGFVAYLLYVRWREVAYQVYITRTDLSDTMLYLYVRPAVARLHHARKRDIYSWLLMAAWPVPKSA